MNRHDEALDRLRRAAWLKDQRLVILFDLLDGATGKTRAVGGAVRDALMNMSRDDTDVDVATQLVPEEVIRRAEAASIKAVPTGVEFGTVTLVIDGKGFEVTTLRRDMETDGRHAKVLFGTDWAADARRRDFTINALYCGPDGELFDPLGGLDDCTAGRVRFIGDADARIGEDRLRVFRFFRFCASHGGQELDPDGLAACAKAADQLDQLSAERVGHELQRMLGLRHVAKTLRRMCEAGIERFLESRLEVLDRYEETTGEPTVEGRLALILLGESANALKARWRLSNAQLKRAEEIRLGAQLLITGQVRRALYRYPDTIAVAVPVAAAMADLDQDWQSEVSARILVAAPAFPITGAQLIAAGMSAGPGLGRSLETLETAWIDSDFTLTQDDLLALAKRIKH